MEVDQRGGESSGVDSVTVRVKMGRRCPPGAPSDVPPQQQPWRCERR